MKRTSKTNASLFQIESNLLGQLFHLTFQLNNEKEDAPQGAFIKKAKAKARKVAHSVLGSRNMTTSFVYNPMITPIQRETIMKRGITDCPSSSSSTPLAPCRAPLSPAPLETYPTEIIFKLFSSSSDEPVIDVACFSDYLNIKHKFVEVGMVEHLGMPHVCISYFFNKLLRDRVIQRRDAPTIKLGALPSKLYFDFTWLVAGKNRYDRHGWRSIVQPPQKQDTSAAPTPLFSGFSYETYMDKYEGDFTLRLYLEHDKGDNYTIIQADILLKKRPRDITWETYLTSI